MIARIHPDEGPEGLLLAIANAHDDVFRWKVAAAVVERARVVAQTDQTGVASRVIWRWTEVGEAFARYLAIALAMDETATDDQIREEVINSWDLIVAGLPPLQE